MFVAVAFQNICVVDAGLVTTYLSQSCIIIISNMTEDNLAH